VKEMKITKVEFGRLFYANEILFGYVVTDRSQAFSDLEETCISFIIPSISASKMSRHTRNYGPPPPLWACGSAVG